MKPNAIDEKELRQALPIGTILKSPKYDYRVEEVLGKGGFGITYKVSTTVLFGKVPIFTYFTVKEHFVKDACERDADGAVSYSRPLQSRVEESRSDFLSEARRLNEISGRNPGVVPVNEVFEANNTVYYVMEYLNGGSLRDLVEEQGALPEREAVAIIRQVANAVDFLHGYNINHLDIKPDNVMFRADYHSGDRLPVLIDFGLAKHFDKKGNPTSSIRVQGCSDGYAPVEQYSGLTKFSPRADIYALGATLYYMLVGRRPVTATEIEPGMVERSLPPTLSAPTRAAIVRAMAYSQFDRTATVADFLSDLDGSGIPSTDVQTVSGESEGGLEQSAGGTDENATRVIDNGKPSSATMQPPFRTEEEVKKNDAGSTEVIGERRQKPMPADDDETPSRRKYLWAIIAVVFVVAGAAGAWYFLNGNSSSKKAAEADIQAVADDYAEYKEICDSCEWLINNSTSGDTDNLLRAKDLMSAIVSMENEYADYSGGDYSFDFSSRYGENLYAKLTEAHDAWVEAAEAQIDLTGDRYQALEYYRLAYRLLSDSATAAAIGRLEQGY